MVLVYTILQISCPTSHWYCPAPAREMLVRCTTLGRRAGVGTLWAGTWDYDFKSHVMVSDSEPVELLLVLVPLDAVQGLPMQVILAPQRHRLVHLGICSYSDAAFITDLCYPHLHQIKLSRYVIICVLCNPGLKNTSVAINVCCCCCCYCFGYCWSLRLNFGLN